MKSRWPACLVALWAVGVVGCATGGGVAADAGPGDGDGDTVDGGPDASVVSCPKEPCDLLEQCGCADPQVCDLNLAELAAGGTECRDVTSPGTGQATCTSLTGCAGGFVCLGSTLGRQCREYCDEDTDCGADSFCTLNIVYDDGSGNLMNVPGAVTCTKACTPEAQVNNNCPGNFGCDIFVQNPGAADEYFFTDCRAAPAAGGGAGVDCTLNGSRDCAAGFTCVIFSVNGTETGRECRQSCRVVGGNCTAGACSAFTDGPVVNGIEYGFCD